MELTRKQFDVLKTLTKGDYSQREIAESTGYSLGTINKALKELNELKYIEDGKIRFDGININKIKKADLRHAMGIVLQDTHLFTGTVADNIRYGKPDATMEEVKQAARLVHAEPFIRSGGNAQSRDQTEVRASAPHLRSQNCSSVPESVSHCRMRRAIHLPVSGSVSTERFGKSCHW